MTITNAITVASQQPAPVPLTPNGSASSGVSFSDILNTINPLQHIPVVSSVYRTLTGSTISATSQIAGDAAYGLAFGGGTLASALIGAVPSAAETAVKDITGTDVVGDAVNAVTGGTSTASSSGTAVSDPDAPAPTAQSAQAAPKIFAFDKHPAVTSAQYHKAVVHDSVDKLLVKMG